MIWYLLFFNKQSYVGDSFVSSGYWYLPNNLSVSLKFSSIQAYIVSNTPLSSFHVCRICSDVSFFILCLLFLLGKLGAQFGEGNGTPLQQSCLENPMDGGAWWAEIHGGCQESDTTELLHFHFSLSCIGEGNDNPLQSSCLENPRDGGAWQAAVYGVAQSWT